MTPKQQELVAAIVTFKVQHGYAPTVRELGDLVGISSPATVHHHLDALERAGIITRSPTKPRTIVVDQPEVDEHATDVPEDPG